MVAGRCPKPGTNGLLQLAELVLTRAEAEEEVAEEVVVAEAEAAEEVAEEVVAAFPAQQRA